MQSFLLSPQLEIGSLEALCVQYIKSSICQENVLVALDSAARLQLDRLKVCLNSRGLVSKETIVLRRWGSETTELIR